MSDALAEEAGAALAEHERRIRARLPEVEIRHIGGTSLPGLLTTGDVDILVRVEEREFAHARETLTELYEPLHPDRWTEEAAFFEVPGSTPYVEFALTVIGSLVDAHHGDAWRQIAADPDLVYRYNAVKRAHELGSIDEYLAAKRAFFSDNFAVE
jgi:GrpB-like predicted nucleotidyltransferase (UPF0157 family)